MQKLNFMQKVLLNNYWMPIAQSEDEWDEIVWRESRKTGARSGVSWKHAINEALETNREAYTQMREKNIQMGKKMQEIVDQEEALAAEERQKARMKKAERVP